MNLDPAALSIDRRTHDAMTPRRSHPPAWSTIREDSVSTTPPPLSFAPRSRSIPLPQWHVPRTASELQISEEQASAEQHEQTMFRRLVDGIRERDRHSPPQIVQQNIAKIVQTRMTDMEQEGEQPTEDPMPRSWSISGFIEEEYQQQALSPRSIGREATEEDDDAMFVLDL